ncbi:Interferon-inducible GTPase 5 [Acipenser ruthenus]|uniref:Interferon-inducible GTPase 5 n=1 Tax=Acipenser ruthenus TaxID=7906 RepID=A0A444USC9_ACIRT|nr:Interferon-inducible GTPase 5 [Acipenser ruthenus]
MAEYGFEEFGEDEVNDIREAMEAGGLAGAAERIQVYLESLDSVELNIAITGESGAGKSTFVNAFRGLKDEDEGAAPTGVVETTAKPTEYPHPKFPNISSDVVLKLLTKAAGGGLMLAGYWLRIFPIIGSVAAGGISFGTTRYMLKSCLEELAEDAQNVLKKAFEVEV